jgi:hypothetical protein
MEKTVFVFLLYSLIPNYIFGNGCDSIEFKTDCITRVYRSQIGVTETGGNNQGPEIASYLKTTGFDYPVPWCAAFINWCFETCQLEGAGSAWSPSWFPQSKTIDITTTEPSPGDVGGIYFASKKRIAHVLFIDEWPQGEKWFKTVEGNTNSVGSRDGDGVRRRIRLKTSLHKVSRWIN